MPSEKVNILAQRKSRIKRNTIQKHKKAKVNRKAHFCKPEFFIGDFRKAERDDMRVKRNFYKTGIFHKDIKADPNKKLVLVLRHRGYVYLVSNYFEQFFLLMFSFSQHIASKQVIEVLREMNLFYKRSAVLLELTEENHALLKIAEPFVTWGYPTIPTVREMIYKYGLFQNPQGVKGPKIVPISNNKDIEDKFGHLGIICVEDLIHELITVGPNFNEVRNVLYAFKMRNPVDGFKNKKGKLFSQGGEAGFRGDEINTLFKRIM